MRPGGIDKRGDVTGATADPGAPEAVVVNYNAGEALIECVASLRREGIARVVVVDNGSVDGSTERLAVADPQVQIVAPGRNVGFGAGANYGVSRTAGATILVCNPDVVLGPGSLRALRQRIATDPSLGLVGPRLVAPDGSERPSGRRFPSLRRSSGQAVLGLVAPGSRASRRYRAASRAGAASGIVDWVTGACLLVRRDAFESVGGFDEGYFMYVEEVDLCMRLARAGWRTGIERGAVVLHLAGVSTAARPYRMVVAHHLSLWRFACRWTTGPDRLLLVLAGPATVLRLVVACATQLAARRPGTHVRGPGQSRLPRRRA